MAIAVLKSMFGLGNPARDVIPHDGLAQPLRTWAMMALGFGMFMGGLDSSIANVALPAIRQELHITPVEVIWVVTAYQMALVACLLAFASLGEIVGYRRVSTTGMALFTIGSLLCAISPDINWLIGARVLQGVGAGAIISVANALLRYIYPRKMLGAGFGTYSMIAASAGAFGPSAATAILAVAPWPYLFWINVPIGVCLFIVALRVLPASDRVARPFDWQGGILSAICLSLLLLVLDGIAQHSPIWVIVAEVIGTILAGIWLTRRELRIPAPVLPVDLLRMPIFVLSVITSLALYATQFLAYVSLPFLFHDNLGMSQGEIGILMTPWPLLLAAIGPFSGRLADRYSPGILCGIGLLLTCIGLLLLAFMPERPSVPGLLWRMAICGIGWGLVVAPNSRAMIVAAPKERTGGSSGITAVSRLFGQTLGTALTAVMFGTMASGAAETSLLLGAGLGLAAAILSFSRHWARQEA